VAAGIAARTGFDVTAVRTVFVVTAVGVFGLAIYLLAWLLIPDAGENKNIASKAVTDRHGITLAAGVSSLLVLALAGFAVEV